jgi:hypothetical protein
LKITIRNSSNLSLNSMRKNAFVRKPKAIEDPVKHVAAILG